MRVEDVISTRPEKDQTTQEHFQEIFRQIGRYFINNAERLGGNVGDNPTSIDVFISLEPNSLVTIDISQKDLLVKQIQSISTMSVNVNVAEVAEKVMDQLNKKLSEVSENE